MASPYGYIDAGDGYLLCKINPGGRCFALATQELMTIPRGGLKKVPKRWLQIRRAPTIIWKPGASPDVTSTMESEMVDLQGAGGLGADAAGAGHDLSPSDQVFVLVGGGVLMGLIGFGAALFARAPRADA